MAPSSVVVWWNSTTQPKHLPATPRREFRASPRYSGFHSKTAGCAGQPIPTGSTATIHARQRLRARLESRYMNKVQPDPMTARDLVGYGEFPPNPDWPGQAVIAVNFNLNVEGGGEATLANGDDGSEAMLNDIGVPAISGRRVPLVESVFEYGSRRGVWRVLEVFRDFSVKVSVLAVARALEQNPNLARTFGERGHEAVTHAE